MRHTIIDWNQIVTGIIIASLFISLVIVFCIILIRVYFRKIKNYTSLLYQKDIDFQKSLNAAIIETQEQVLNNISRDLHDDAGQQLTYINFQLENLKLDSAQMQHHLQPLSESVGHLSESIRSISHSLNNQLLTQQDLIKAITAETARLQKNEKVTIDIAIEGQSKKDFSVNEKIFIFRIFQEIVNNIFKHAAATKIDIRIKMNPHFEMQISDNGKGFDPTDAQKNPTLGLQNMYGRAAIINYKLSIDSAKGHGTTITLLENKTL